jgi:plastocyanin
MDLLFIPHVLPVLAGTAVAFPNNDTVRHNVFSPSPAKRFNLGSYAQKVTKHVVFDKPGVVALLCNVHAEMSAYVVVAWHESSKPKEQKVEVKESNAVRVDFDLR